MNFQMKRKISVALHFWDRALLLLIFGALFGACASTNPTPDDKVANATKEAKEATVAPINTAEAASTPTPQPLPTPNIFAGPRYDLPLKLPGAVTPPKVTTSRDLNEIAVLQAKQKKYPTYDALRRLGDIYLKNSAFAEVAQMRRAEAAMYRAALSKETNPARRKTSIHSALILDQEAARYETQVQIFQERRASDVERKQLYSGAKLEPILGCYIGAFIDRDDQLKTTYFDENWQTHRTSEEFAQVTGVNHASHFMYVSYGQKFPTKWVERCKAENVIPHIAWEPKSLNEVRDDAYLRGWAKSCRAANWPIFIRFAGEMNGPWVPYHNNPALYREKFRLMHRIIRESAPLTATIWCVAAVPIDNIQNYYPGDDGCDWVGVNFYSVPFYDNNPQRPGLLDNPIVFLEPIYKLYAKKKPIAICEYAASHMGVADKKRRDDFAIDKMAQLYTALPALFPRVKMINWFSANNIKHARPGRQLNNYNLTERPKVLAHYRQIASSRYFLSGPERLSDPRPALPFVLSNNAKLSLATSTEGTTRLLIWLKTHVSRPKVYAGLNGKIFYASNRPGAHNVDINLKLLKPGPQTLTIYVFDDKNRFVTQMQRRFSVAT